MSSIWRLRPCKWLSFSAPVRANREQAPSHIRPHSKGCKRLTVGGGLLPIAVYLLKRSTNEYWVFAVCVSSSLNCAEFIACSEV